MKEKKVKKKKPSKRSASAKTKYRRDMGRGPDGKFSMEDV